MKRDIGALFPELEKDHKPYTAEATTGILPFQEICRLIDGGRINAAGGIERAQVQPASLDLRLGTIAYRVRASFLPSGGTVLASNAMSHVQAAVIEDAAEIGHRLRTILEAQVGEAAQILNPVLGFRSAIVNP